MLQKVEPDDLVRFGLIPEFIGRLPSIAVLDPLDEAALIDILIKPKNALTKQYQKLFSYENVELKFEDSALRAIAREAIKRNTGARGLRGVIESAMLDIMFEIPSKTNVKEVVITEDVIKNGVKPQVVLGRETGQRSPKRRVKTAKTTQQSRHSTCFGSRPRLLAYSPGRPWPDPSLVESYVKSFYGWILEKPRSSRRTCGKPLTAGCRTQSSTLT